MSLRNGRILLGLVVVAAWVAGGCGDAGAGTDGGADVVADTPGDTPGDGSTDADSGADTEVVGPVEGSVVLNEVFAEDGPGDWIELVNPGETVVDLSGWAVTDSDPTHVYTFPSGSKLGPKAHLVLVRDPAKGFDFGLSPDDSVVVYSAKGAQVDRAAWPPGAILGGRSYGRIPDATGELGVLATPTPGEANVANPDPTCGAGGLEIGEVCDGAELGGLTCEHLGLGAGHLTCATGCDSLDTSGCGPLVGSVRINELESSGTDRIELRNTSDKAVSLDGYVLADALGGVYLFGAQAQLA
ncbi:MAG: lamin tail domain-containing protein, partial [Myxococcota bacterium]